MYRKHDTRQCDRTVKDSRSILDSESITKRTLANCFTAARCLMSCVRGMDGLVVNLPFPNLTVVGSVAAVEGQSALASHGDDPRHSLSVSLATRRCKSAVRCP